LEKTSPFSPEDLYSNALGIEMLTAIARHRSGRAENVYYVGVDAWTKTALAMDAPAAAVLAGTLPHYDEASLGAARNAPRWFSALKVRRVGVDPEFRADQTHVAPTVHIVDEALHTSCHICREESQKR